MEVGAVSSASTSLTPFFLPLLVVLFLSLFWSFWLFSLFLLSDLGTQFLLISWISLANSVPCDTSLGWVVAADAPTGFQRVQPLLQAADGRVQRSGLAPGDVQLSLRARSDPGDASHLALARVYLALEELDPPAEVDNPPPGGIRVAVPWWVVGVPRGSSRRASAGSARSRGSSPARWSASRGSTWWASSRGS